MVVDLDKALVAVALFAVLVAATAPGSAPGRVARAQGTAEPQQVEASARYRHRRHQRAPVPVPVHLAPYEENVIPAENPTRENTAPKVVRTVPIFRWLEWCTRVGGPEC